MLFNTYTFIFAFLPAAVLSFHLLSERGYRDLAVASLIFASLFFYGWWNPAYLSLIAGSVLFNYTAGSLLRRLQPVESAHLRRLVAILAIAANLGVLGYFKYANFFVENISALIGTTYNLKTIILPLAISFFTFQQIAYLVDTYRGETRDYRFLHYALFVTFFPQLIAGPIVQHKELFPQLQQNRNLGFRLDKLAVGISIFIIGLFKKVVLADGIAVYASPVFNAAADGTILTFIEGWGGALSYTFQLYFDFSGYSDMAIGLGYMFGLRLPMNFHSPFKAASIIEFWKHWHITLTRFITTYVFTPVALPLTRFSAGSGMSAAPAFVLTIGFPLMLTFLLAGLWHGAGWTFVVFGGLHGLYLVTNHGWRLVRKNLFGKKFGLGVLERPLSQTLTFAAVVVSLVFFRADNMASAISMIDAMAGSNGFVFPVKYLAKLNGLYDLGDSLLTAGWRFESLSFYWGVPQAGSLIGLAAWVFLAPNTHQFMGIYSPALAAPQASSQSRASTGFPLDQFRWKPTFMWATAIAFLAAASLLSLQKVSEFLYFQF